MSKKSKRKPDTRHKRRGVVAEGKTVWGSITDPAMSEREIAGRLASPVQRRDLLHPSLRGLPDDASVPVLMVPDDGVDPPERAGELLGILNRPYPAADGGEVPAGYRVFRDADPSRESAWIPAGMVREVRAELASGQYYTQGASRIAAELGWPSPDATPPSREIPAGFRRDAIRAKLVTGGERTDGGPGLPEGLLPGDIIAEEQPLGYVDSGIRLPGGGEIRPGAKVYRVADRDVAAAVEAAQAAGYEPVTDVAERLTALTGGSIPPETARRVAAENPGFAAQVAAGLEAEAGPPVIRGVPEGAFLPPGFTHRDPDPPLVMSLRAGEVLDVHARLAETMRRPPPALLKFFGVFISEALEKAHSEGGLPGAHSTWAGSFWPATSAPEWCGVLARQLVTARTYQVSAAMTGEVTGAYQAVRDRSPGPWVEQDEVPWPAGFAWLDAPLDFRDRWGRAAYTRALSWDVAYLDYPGGKRPGFRLVSWSHPADRDAYWSETVAEKMEASGGLAMGNSMVIPFGQRLYAQRYEGYPEPDNTAIWLKALWRMMETEIVTPAPAAEISHLARKRARRVSLKTDVHVILLRRRHTVTGDGPGHRDVHWTCQWPVDPFWRHARRDPAWEDANIEHDEHGRRVRHHAIPGATRERCIICGAKITYVNSFVKGPPGLPWKHDRQLYRLAR
jgi:hypothetical protein